MGIIRKVAGVVLVLLSIDIVVLALLLSTGVKLSSALFGVAMSDLIVLMFVGGLSLLID